VDPFGLLTMIVSLGAIFLSGPSGKRTDRPLLIFRRA
jgi:hypothetical protein